jgi:anhydro-N-acetylmuramic acid kinase
MIPSKPKTMLVAGVMSGTSADGVDVAICRISPALKKNDYPRIKVLGHRSFPYPASLRKAALAAASSQQANTTSTAELSRLNWRLGEVYAACIQATANDLNLKPSLIACHGQTIYHQGAPAKYLGHPIRTTWQIGEPAVIAAQLQLPVISDFRPADMAAGGQGAPLVPMLDFCLFHHATKNRLLLNLGGIANFTALPAACSINDVLAFDTGPANMVIDACMQRLFNRRYDRNGYIAAKGRVLPGVITRLLETPYFSAPPPKSCGREEFGSAFTDRFIALCKRNRATPHDIIATATAFTAATILDAYSRFAWPHLGQRAPLPRATQIFAAGGGAHNPTLLRMLRGGFEPLGVSIATTEQAGLAIEAKEAAAFALLGWLTWHGLPGNVPSATGATRHAILGKVSLP